MVVGLLAILKAGGAYVPLDPAYPKERLRFMLEDARCSVLLTQQYLVEGRELMIEDTDNRQSSILSPRIQVVCLDRDSELIKQQNEGNPPRSVISENSAYVIYTSGSTGTPKGVVGLHRGAVNRFAWMWKSYPFGENEKCCIKTSLNFVDSVWEFFGPLLQGVPAVIIPDRIVKDPEHLTRTLSDIRVTRIVLVPSMLKAILDAVPNLQSQLPDLKLWSSSGEYLPTEVADRFQKSAPNAILLNLYGCTEAAADVSFYDCRNRRPASDVPLGRPISNTHIYILDSKLQPMPIGTPGELYIGGGGLARAYLNRHDLTCDRFIPDPFSEDPRVRLYRTGDRACYLPDGNIKFLGRVDNQVKIRGYRIELGEIESVIGQNPAVEHCVVFVHDREPAAEKLVVAYIVRKRFSHQSSTEIRDYLRRRLPDYMIPSAFVTLQELPLTPNGKVDRTKILTLDARQQGLRDSVPARTEPEELIAQIWKEVLGLEELGVHEDFFRLGGHSLLATQIVYRLREISNKSIPLAVLFECSTVAALAQYLQHVAGHESSVNLPPLTRVEGQHRFPLSVSQQQLWALDKSMPSMPFFNMPYAYRLTGPLNENALADALISIVRRHHALRTVFMEIDGCPYQIVGPVPKSILQVLDVSTTSSDELEGEIGRLLGEESSLPFDLGTGPLIRTRLYRLDHDHNILLVVIHHIISDRWSMNVFFRELVTSYRAVCEGHPPTLSEPPIQPGDFAIWEKTLLANGFVDHQIDYWRKQLAGSLPQIKFVQRADQANNFKFQTSRESIAFSQDFFAELRRFAREESCTTFMVLHAAFVIMLHQYTGEEDVRIGAMVANRGQPKAEGAIGHFVNTVVLRTRISAEFSFRTLLKSVRDTILGACANLELPFEKLTQILEVERSIDRTALTPALINYQNFSSEALEACGLSFAPLGWQQPSALEGIMFTTFDLVLNVRETSTAWTGHITFKTETFNHAARREMLNRFESILVVMVHNPEQKVSEALVNR